jgi:MFS family permease
MELNRKIIYYAEFLYSIPISFAYFINSSFIASLTNEKFVGIVYALGALTSILALIYASKIFRKLGGYKFLIVVTFLDVLSFLSLALIKNTWILVSAFILGIALNTLIIFSLDEILKIFSQSSVTGRVRGIYIMLSNLPLILIQLLIYVTVLGKFSYREIYFTGFLTMLFFLITSLLTFKNLPDPNYDRKNPTRYMQDFFRNKNLARAFGLTFLLQFFYCSMVIYTPIYLYSYLHFSWSQIGIIFTIMLLPFLFLPIGCGTYADKIGERKILMFGFTVMALATLSLFFITKNTILIWATLLFITRIGAATVEPMADTYFFKHIKSKNEEFISVYRSASPAAYIATPFIALAVFYIVPSFNFIFLVLGIVMLFGIYLASTIEKGDI